MDIFTKNPGFQHIAEEIFLNLDIEKLEKCETVNESWSSIIEDPSFWLRKCLKNGFLHKNKTAWERAIQVTKKVNLEKNIVQLLKQK